MKLCEEPQADDGGRESKEGVLNVGESIESAAKATEGVEPGIGPLDRPAFRSQTAAVFGVAGSEDRRYSQPTQDGSQRFGIKAAVTLEPLGVFALGPWFATDGRHRCQNM